MVSPSMPAHGTNRCYQLCLDCRPPTEEEEEDSGSSSSPRLLELAFTRNDPSSLAEEFLRAFFSVHAEGLVDRDLALGMMCV